MVGQIVAKKLPGSFSKAASQNSPQATNFSYIKQYSNQSGLTEYNSEYGFHFQHRNSRTF
jgi:hypothetical protein